MTRAALLALLRCAESLVGEFSAGEGECMIDRLAAAALTEAATSGGDDEGGGGCAAAPATHAAALHHLLTSHGWNGRTFARPLEPRCLASRLKALLFDGLRPCGSGTYR